MVIRSSAWAVAVAMSAVRLVNRSDSLAMVPGKSRRSLRDLPGTIARLSERLTNLTADMATATAHADDRITIGKRSYSRDDTPAALGDYLHNLPERVMQKQ